MDNIGERHCTIVTEHCRLMEWGKAGHVEVITNVTVYMKYELWNTNIENKVRLV